jgi:hypothetical protein
MQTSIAWASDALWETPRRRHPDRARLHQRAEDLVANTAASVHTSQTRVERDVKRDQCRNRKGFTSTSWPGAREQQFFTSGSLGTSFAACGSTKKETQSRFYKPLQPNALGVLRFFFYPDAAIAREKEIKGRRREKKLALVESMNPRWADLAEKWQDLYKPGPAVDCNEIPRPAGQNAGLRDDAVVDGDNR